MSEKDRDTSMTDAQRHASDQHAEMRHKVYVQIISIAGKEVDREAVSGNLSRDGLFIATPDLVEVGTEIEVRFRLPSSNSRITARAEVAWTNEDKDFAAGEMPGYGVQFVALEEGNQDELDRYMDHFEQDGHELS